MADMRNRRNVLVGAPDVTASGGVLIGPVATKPEAFPTSATEDLSADLGLVPAGYISEDGVSKTVDRSTEKIKDWNGDTILITQSDHSVTLTLTFMEAANADVLKMIAGEDNVTITEDGTIQVIDNADELPHRAINFEIKGGRGSKIRVFAPDVQCTSVGDVSYVRADVIKYEATLECFDVDNKKLLSLIKRAEENGVAVAGGADAPAAANTELDAAA